MATVTETKTSGTEWSASAKSQNEAPLKLSGALEAYESFDVTPVIGREYPTLNLKEALEASNSDELIRDIAITSERSALLWLSSQHPLTSSSLPTRCCVLQEAGRA